MHRVMQDRATISLQSAWYLHAAPMFTWCSGGSKARRCMTDKANGVLPKQRLLIGNVYLRSNVARKSKFYLK